MYSEDDSSHMLYFTGVPVFGVPVPGGCIMYRYLVPGTSIYYLMWPRIVTGSQLLPVSSFHTPFKYNLIDPQDRLRNNSQC